MDLDLFFAPSTPHFSGNSLNHIAVAFHNQNTELPYGSDKKSSVYIRPGGTLRNLMKKKQNTLNADKQWKSFFRDLKNSYYVWYLEWTFNRSKLSVLAFLIACMGLTLFFTTLTRPCSLSYKGGHMQIHMARWLWKVADISWFGYTSKQTHLFKLFTRPDT